MKTLSVVIVLLALYVSFAHAEIPRTISYQGFMTDAEGNAVPDGTYEVTFSLYNSHGANESLWSEKLNVTIREGILNVILGKTNPLSLPFDTAYWLGIAIGAQSELVPRIELTAAAYALASPGGGGGSDGDGYSLDAVDGDPLDAVYVDSLGEVGIGTTNPTAALHISANHPKIKLNMPASSTDNLIELRFYKEDTIKTAIAWDKRNGRTTFSNQGHISIVIKDRRVGIGVLDPVNALDVKGTTTTDVLEINGGSDLAEPFDFSSQECLVPGAVVVIDPECSGKLKVSEDSYDTRVAGVVSGAGGINPGITLSQQTRREKELHVALSGKVYALATTSNGPIEPGDLLTTSDIPGHAMKATNIELSNGAIIGKAMSSLKEGQGLVLVLVNLQ
jgi:hypothetical protein